MTEDAHILSVVELSHQIHSNELSPLDLVDALLHRIKQYESTVQAWVTLDRDSVCQHAKIYSDDAAKGMFQGLLHGIPLGVKDIYYTKDMDTTAGSQILTGFRPGYDATPVQRLKTSGAIILGKTETTEFATFDPAPTRNPWNLDHTPGGSSSGSAAAVAIRMCPAALGSQTGGSIIRPAAYCGVVGLKPTYGRISRYGVIPVSWSLDHVGTFTRSVEDAALLLEVLAGPDSKDPTSVSYPIPTYRSTLDAPVPPRLGLVQGFFHDRAQAEVQNNIRTTIRSLESHNATIMDTPLPTSFNAVHAAHRVIMISEVATIHKTIFQTRMHEYRPNLRSMIASGLLIDATTYLNAQRIRSHFIKDALSLFDHCDCLVMPSTPSAAPKGLTSTGDPAFNSPWSFCGFPALSLPSGVTKEGLPLGIQLVAQPFCEDILLQAGAWCEQVINFIQCPPNV
jgi:aspartyl-tRNA(Asn)/glutamyl-tRNA(Gln) amidotransferase subunit A